MPVRCLALGLLLAAGGIARAQPAPNGATQARLAATAKCAAHEPCDWMETLSSLERQSLRRALAAGAVELEPSPWGKTIGRVRVFAEDVFAEKNWLQFFNLFHATTKDNYISEELTIREGELWDDDRVQESQRRVKDPLYHSVVVLVPIKSTEADKVDLLVVTRDVWSLRLNTKYVVQDCESVWYNPLRGCSLTDLLISVSENNFLGRRKLVALAFDMDQGAVAGGPLYVDKNWLLTEHHFELRAGFQRIFTRRSLDIITEDNQRIPTGDPKGFQDGGGIRAEGTTANLTLNKPLWALATPWAVGGNITYRDAITRQYLGDGLRSYDDPDTEALELLPRQYRMRTWGVRASATRQWGDDFKHRVEAGYSVSSQRPSLLGSFEFDPVLEDHFRRDVFPRSELVSAPFVEYSMFQARFRMLRNIDTYELAEDVRFGPGASVGLTQTFKTLGSDFRFTRPSFTLNYTVPWGRDGFARVEGGAQIRIQDGDAIDNTATGGFRAVSPTLGYVRVVAQGTLTTRWDDRQNLFYTLGSENGLRAYRIAQQFGDRKALGQVEIRSVPLPFWVLRFGGVVFYEGGSTAASFGQMPYLHDVGIGMRVLVPQTSRELFRFDLAFPLAPAPGTPAGPPRFIAGFDSYF